MSGVLCAWSANIPQSSEQWFEDEYIPSMTSRFAQSSLHCEVVEIGLEGSPDGTGPEEIPWKWLTVYEMEDASKAIKLASDPSNHPPRTGGLEDARYDIRVYEEIKRWQQEDWEGDHADIASVAVMEWQIDANSDVEKEVLDFYMSEAAPTVASSPDVLRFRMLKINNAAMLKADSYETLEKKNLHTYLTLAELESEEWPWDMVVALCEKPKWRKYFEEQSVVKWRSSHYVVRRSYPDVDEE